MAAYRLVIVVFVLYVTLISVYVGGERTNKKIYTNLKAEYPCFRRLNATHQVGCASSRRGNVGVIHYVTGVTDLEWVLEHGPYSPYIIVIEAPYFNKKNLTKMKNSDKVSGVLVLSPSLTRYPSQYSPDQSCPNQNYGMYTNVTNEYDGCSVQWNKVGDGMFFEDWTFPIFLVDNEEDYKQLVDSCYTKFNAPIDGKPREWPLCAAQLYTSMYAAKDSKTCLRRSQMITNLNPTRYCDPLGDYNIWSTLLPMNKSIEIENRSIIVVAARMDSFSMFDNIGPGGDSAVSGIVALLSVAKALSAISSDRINPKKNVLFMLFNGEAFDYLGSSRVVYDMQNDGFPLPLSDDMTSQPPLISFNKISHFIELSQVGIPGANAAVYVHTDPISTQSTLVNNTVNEMIYFMEREAKSIQNVTVVRSAASNPLPPASLQSFLKMDLQIPGIVISDHEREYSNVFYNSMNDGHQIDQDSAAVYIEKTVTIVSHLIDNLLTNRSSTLAPPKDLVFDLLKCYMDLKNCSLFNETSSVKTNQLSRNPSFYVGVEGNSNILRVFSTQLFSYLVGEVVPNATHENCTNPSDNSIYNYRWMIGNESSVCIKSTVGLSPARSPAFEINGYDFDSNVYPVWTESVWNSFSLRIFLKPSLQQEVITLCVGFLVLILSFSVVWFMSQSSNLLFTPNAEVVTIGVAC